ncbi:MAG: triphosphoribosyl-dephospho-CoA synthase [Planctomycetaceae bacterium]|nr:triphosphoribosyl-dephospho-CoA synthase [Planctomycetaceae bacterium]
MSDPLCDVATAICLACQWEAVAAKPGNVHRSADFADVGLMDFLNSGVAVANVARNWSSLWLDQAKETGPTFGQFVWEAVQATRGFTPSNTNLGICLLLGPLAEAWVKEFGLHHVDEVREATLPTSLAGAVADVHVASECHPNDAVFMDARVAAGLARWRNRVCQLTSAASVEQTRWIYAAIALAKPGGLGTVAAADVMANSKLHDSDTVAHVMQLAVQRDSIASEYVSGFKITFERTVPSLHELLLRGGSMQWAIVGTFLRLMAEHPDTLIARKVGWQRATEVSVWAGQLAEEFFSTRSANLGTTDWIEACEPSLGDLDFALRSDGNRLNPGTTADLIAAGLFVALRSGSIGLPVRW